MSRRHEVPGANQVAVLQDMLGEMCHAIRAPVVVRDTALELYAKTRMCGNKYKLHAVAAAVLYEACRRHRIYYRSSDFCRRVHVPRNEFVTKQRHLEAALQPTSGTEIGAIPHQIQALFASTSSTTPSTFAPLQPAAPHNNNNNNMDGNLEQEIEDNDMHVGCLRRLCAVLHLPPYVERAAVDIMLFFEQHRANGVLQLHVRHTMTTRIATYVHLAGRLCIDHDVVHNTSDGDILQSTAQVTLATIKNCMKSLTSMRVGGLSCASVETFMPRWYLAMHCIVPSPVRQMQQHNKNTALVQCYYRRMLAVSMRRSSTSPTMVDVDAAVAEKCLGDDVAEHVASRADELSKKRYASRLNASCTCTIDVCICAVLLHEKHVVVDVDCACNCVRNLSMPPPPLLTEHPLYVLLMHNME